VGEIGEADLSDRAGRPMVRTDKPNLSFCWPNMCSRYAGVRRRFQPLIRIEEPGRRSHPDLPLGSDRIARSEKVAHQDYLGHYRGRLPPVLGA
jgi:hypothetical protein